MFAPPADTHAATCRRPCPCGCTATTASNFECSNFEIEVFENAYSAYVQCTFDQAWNLSEPLARHTALCNCTESLVGAVDNYLDMYASCSAAQRFRARYSAHLDRSSCRTGACGRGCGCGCGCGGSRGWGGCSGGWWRVLTLAAGSPDRVHRAVCGG